MRILTLLLILLAVYALPAEILKIEESETYLYTASLSPKLHSTITNTSDKKQTFTIVRKDLQIPEGWEAYFCFQACFPSFLNEATVSLEPGESEVLQIDFTIAEDNKEGSALVQMIITPEEKSDEVQIRTYGITYRKEFKESAVSFSVKKASLIIPKDKTGEHEITLENKSDEDQEVSISWEKLSMKDDLSVTVCIDLCLPEFVSSTDYTIKASEKVKMKISATPSDTGTGVVQFNIGPKSGDITKSLIFTYPTEGVEAIVLGSSSPKQLFVQRVGNLFTLEMPESGATSVVLVNTKGQLVSELYRNALQGSRTLSVPLPALGTGIYFLAVTNGSLRYSLPVTIE